MPVHDWTRVDAGTFHSFHLGWIAHLTEALNGGVLPSGYYAMAEQHGGRLIADILTLQRPVQETSVPALHGGVAVVDAPPRVRRKLEPASAYRIMRRTLTIRHVIGHRVIALIEIVSPANKDRASNVSEFSEKIRTALSQGIHVILADLLPPGSHDPQGMHGAIWQFFDDELYELPAGEPFTMASYVGGVRPEGYAEHFALGAPLIDMPLFLTPDRYVNIPLESTYMAAYRGGMPEFLRDIIEGRQKK